MTSAKREEAGATAVKQRKTVAKQPPRIVRKRPRFRRELILSAAIKLFREKGYERTGMDDIGPAVGITGSAVYRHFAGKQILLTAIFERVNTAYEQGTFAITQLDLDPAEKIRQLTAFKIDFILRFRDELAVIDREKPHLAEPDFRRFHQSRQMIMDEWTSTLAAARPEIKQHEAKAIVYLMARMTAPLAVNETGLSEVRFRDLTQRAYWAVLMC